MRTREFPVLSEADRNLLDRLALGLGEDAARVLGYLLLRDREFDGPASRLAIRVGTGLNQDTIAGALRRLEQDGIVAATPVQDSTRGRPPKAWRAADGIDATIRRVYDRHARTLLERASDAGDLETDGPSGGPAGNDGRADRLHVGLNWEPNPLHAPWFAAAATDSYRDRGVDVSLHHFRGSGRAIQGLGGEVDVALAGAATVLRRRSRGAGLVTLAVPYQRAMTVLYTIRDAFGTRFESVGDLRGRRIGMPEDSETGLLARLFLAQAGVLDDVTIVAVPGEEQAALRAGRTDVVTGTFSDPQALEAEGVTVDSLAMADRFPMYGPALVTTRDTVDERPDVLARFLAGTIAGWATAAADPDRAVSAIDADEEPSERDVRTVEHALAEFGTSAAVRNHGWGWQRPEEWERLETALAQVGLLNGTA